MKVKWKKLFALVVMWLATEIFLNFLGVDDIADYSEFVFEKHAEKAGLLTVAVKPHGTIQKCSSCGHIV